MGWASGSELMEVIINTIFRSVPNPEIREEMYNSIIDAMENMDWDTQEECMGIDYVYDKIIRERYTDLADDFYGGLDDDYSEQ